VSETLLAALAVAIEGNADEKAALSSVDPLLRPFTRRRLRRSVLAARALTSEPDHRHVLRLAWLTVAGTTPEQPDDVEAVRGIWDKATSFWPRRPPSWRLTKILALVLFGGFIAGSLAVIWPRRSLDVNRPAPPPAGVFATGGVAPTAAPEIAERFQETLPDYFIALDRWSRRRGDDTALREAREALVDPGVVGPGVAKRLAELADAARRVHETADARLDGAAEVFSDAAGALDDELTAAGIPLFVDVDLVRSTTRRTTFAFSFTVEEVHLYRSGKLTVRALYLRRLDRMNYTQTLLGFTRPSLREGLVLLDQLSEQVESELMPALADDVPYPTDLEPDEDFPEGIEVARHIGESVRAELRAAVAGAPEHEVTERLTQVVGRSVARHEVQHRLDRSGAGRRLPRELAELVGPLIDDEGEERPHVVRARAELSAYLAEVARADEHPTTRLELADLARNLLEKDRWGTAECWASLVILDGLARELGISAGSLLVAREIDRTVAAHIITNLVARPETEVRAAAARLWARLFGEPLPPLERV
jgi:hypothetical protein